MKWEAAAADRSAFMGWPSMCFSSLKKERIRKRICKTRELARADVFDYIEEFYNRIRRHSHLGGVSPEAYEQASF